MLEYWCLPLRSAYRAYSLQSSQILSLQILRAQKQSPYAKLNYRFELAGVAAANTLCCRVTQRKTGITAKLGVVGLTAAERSHRTAQSYCWRNIAITLTDEL